MDNQELFKTFFLFNKNRLSIETRNSENLEIIFSKKSIFFSKENNFISKDTELFLLKNIEEIEKKTKSFVKNISLILEAESIFTIKLSFKKKVNQKIIPENELKSLLTNGLQLIYKNYSDCFIIHYMIENFIVDDEVVYSIKDKIINSFLCVELKFICIEKNYIDQFRRLFQKKEIHLEKVFSERYLSDFAAKNENIVESAFKIEKGLNKLEVKLVPKKREKKGFFENFFLIFQ